MLNLPTQILKTMLTADGLTFFYMSMDFYPFGLILLYMWQATKITEKHISKCSEKILTNQECHIQFITNQQLSKFHTYINVIIIDLKLSTVSQFSKVEIFLKQKYNISLHEGLLMYLLATRYQLFGKWENKSTTYLLTRYHLRIFQQLAPQTLA